MKREYINTQWEVATYEVWGNVKDGFEVNSAHQQREPITLRLLVKINNAGTPYEFRSAFPTDRQLRDALNLSPIQLDTEGDDITVYVSHRSSGYPHGQLRCVSHESLSPIRVKS
jgi:hypothetical protein